MNHQAAHVGQQDQPKTIWAEQFTIHSYEVDFKKEATLESLCHHFQEAAWNHAEHLGAGYHRLLEQNRFWVLARLRIEIARRPAWAETVTIRTWPRAAKSVFAMRDFEIFGADGQRCLAGASAWLVLDTSTRKPQRVDKIIAGITSLSELRALEHDPDKLPQPEVSSKSIALTVRYSDIDVNAHVNHARYISWLLDSYPIDFHRGHKTLLLEMNYLGETVGGEPISLLSSEAGSGEYWHSVIKSDTGDEVCRARLVWKPNET